MNFVAWRGLVFTLATPFTSLMTGWKSGKFVVFLIWDSVKFEKSGPRNGQCFMISLKRLSPFSWDDFHTLRISSFVEMVFLFPVNPPIHPQQQYTLMQIAVMWWCGGKTSSLLVLLQIWRVHQQIEIWKEKVREREYFIITVSDCSRGEFAIYVPSEKKCICKFDSLLNSILLWRVMEGEVNISKWKLGELCNAQGITKMF